MRPLLKLAAIALTLAITLVCTERAIAQDGLTLMRVEAGARQAGMGGAFAAIAGSPDGSYYNPAAATGVDDLSASFGHNTFWTNVRLETGYFSVRTGKKSYMHGSIRFARISGIEFRTSPTAQPEGLFDANDVSFKMGAAWDITQKITAGMSAGWFIEKIDIWRGSAFNLDFGLLARLRSNFSVGASVTNMGSDLTLSASGRTASRDISLPVIYRLGGALEIDRYLGALDLAIVDDRLRAHLGAEAAMHESFSIRAGYMGNYDSKNITAGLSLKRRNITIDYAFVPFTHNLGTSHLFNFTFVL